MPKPIDCSAYDSGGVAAEIILAGETAETIPAPPPDHIPLAGHYGLAVRIGEAIEPDLLETGGTYDIGRQEHFTTMLLDLAGEGFTVTIEPRNDNEPSADTTEQYPGELAVLRRVAKYAIEDEAKTKRSTRLARALHEHTTQTPRKDP